MNHPFGLFSVPFNQRHRQYSTEKTDLNAEKTTTFVASVPEMGEIFDNHRHDGTKEKSTCYGSEAPQYHVGKKPILAREKRTH